MGFWGRHVQCRCPGGRVKRSLTMKPGDPKKARDLIATLDNIGYCVVAVFLSLFVWGLILVVDWIFDKIGS